MKFTQQISINAPAEKVWDILGRDFVNVGTWATAVSHSEVNASIPSVNNSPVGARTCTTSFGKASEEFTAYDDAKRTYSFKGVFESKMFTNVTSSAQVESVNESTSVTKLTPEVELTFLGKLMYPIIKMQLNKSIVQALEDLKYYVENGKPSPAKLASQQK